MRPLRRAIADMLAAEVRPEIVEAAAVGVPDDDFGQRLRAFVVTPRTDHEALEEELRDWVRSNLAGFKVPRAVRFGELPKTSTGKIQKFVLREQARDL